MNKEKISQLMHEQNHRCTQYPLFAIQEDNEIWVGKYDDCGYDIQKRSDDIDEDELCENCLELFNNSDDLPDECNSCSDCCFEFFKIEKVFNLKAGVFFTEKACLEHIEANKYHYNNPVCFCISAWRNEEMQTIMQDILKCTNKEIPNHYQ